MVCDKTVWRASIQTVYFGGHLVGSLIMGILADQFVKILLINLMIRFQFFLKIW